MARRGKTDEATHPCTEIGERTARYLLALLDLSQGDKPPTQAAVAREVGVAQPSALEMIRRLRESNLILPDELTLSPEGMSVALVLSSRRRAAEALTHDVLGLDEEAAKAEAEYLASSASPELGRRLIAWRAAQRD